MSYQTVSATRLEAVLIEARADGMGTDVWLRKNIEMDVADNGPDAGKATEFYRADEVHFAQVGTPTVDEVTAAFDELWAAHDGDDMTDAERIAALALSDSDNADALAELGDMLAEQADAIAELGDMVAALQN